MRFDCVRREPYMCVRYELAYLYYACGRHGTPLRSAISKENVDHKVILG
jgi:hypothetical protein